MAFEIDWSPDFCLSCDRQTNSGAPYCSQSCRLADLESKSDLPSPGLDSSRHFQSSPSPLELNSGFYLPVAYNFNVHISGSRQPTQQSAASTARQHPYNNATKTSVFSSSSSSTSSSQRLVTSGSRTSLSSLRSSSSTESFTLSDKARSELRDYASAFDQVRNWKRRVTHS